MAGSAILNYQNRSEELLVATVTVNNGCNLRCRHCYLQDGQPDGLISDDYFNAILDSSATHVVLVGKEPLKDPASVRHTDRLIRKAKAARKKVSFITNGHLLNLLDPFVASMTQYIDVSFDGGPRTYGTYRGGSYRRLVRNIEGLASSGVRFRALHVLSDETLGHIDDMMATAAIRGVEHVVFSLYVPTRNNGENKALPVTFTDAIGALANSESFRNSDKAVLLLAQHELGMDDAQIAAFTASVRQQGLDESKVRIITEDPVNLGFARFTYNQRALTPLDSIHTAGYGAAGIRWTGQPIAALWARLCSPRLPVLAN